MDLQNQLLGNAEFSDLFDPSTLQPQANEFSWEHVHLIYSLILDRNGIPDYSKFKKQKENGMRFTFKTPDSQKVPNHCQLVYCPILDMLAIQPDSQNKYKISLWIPEYNSLDQAVIVLLVHKKNPDPSEPDKAVVEIQPDQREEWLKKQGCSSSCSEPWVSHFMQLDPKDSHRGKYYKRENDHCILEIPVSKFKKCPVNHPDDETKQGYNLSFEFYFPCPTQKVAGKGNNNAVVLMAAMIAPDEHNVMKVIDGTTVNLKVSSSPGRDTKKLRKKLAEGNQQTSRPRRKRQNNVRSSTEEDGEIYPPSKVPSITAYKADNPNDPGEQIEVDSTMQTPNPRPQDPPIVSTSQLASEQELLHIITGQMVTIQSQQETIRSKQETNQSQQETIRSKQETIRSQQRVIEELRKEIEDSKTCLDIDSLLNK